MTTTDTVAARDSAKRTATPRGGRSVARPGARLGAGRHVMRFRVTRTGEHLVRLTAADARGSGSARDQAQLSVNRCDA